MERQAWDDGGSYSKRQWGEELGRDGDNCEVLHKIPRGTGAAADSCPSILYSHRDAGSAMRAADEAVANLGDTIDDARGQF